MDARELRVLLQDTGVIARETGELLLSLQRDATPRQRTMLAKLNKDFQSVLHRFQQLAEQSARHAQQADDLEAGSGGGSLGGASGASAGAAGAFDDDDDDDEDDEAGERGALLGARSGATTAAVAAAAQQQPPPPPQHRCMQAHLQLQSARTSEHALAERERMIQQVRWQRAIEPNDPDD